MRGISIAVDDVEAAGAVLANLGMTRGHGGPGVDDMWVAGKHFLALKRKGPVADGTSDRAIHLSGGSDFSVADVKFEGWSAAEPLPAEAGPGTIKGIDHVIAMVDSVDEKGRVLQDRGVVTRTEQLREFPALSTRARMYLLGDGFIELNEPLGSGTPVWGNVSGIVGVVLESDEIEQFRSNHPDANLSRVSDVQARRPGMELETLGSVSLVKTRAFGDFQLYLYAPRLR